MRNAPSPFNITKLLGRVLTASRSHPTKFPHFSSPETHIHRARMVYEHITSFIDFWVYLNSDNSFFRWFSDFLTNACEVYIVMYACRI